MSTNEQATKGFEEMQLKGITTWPAAFVAVLFRFGVGVGAIIALVAVLGYISHAFWSNMLNQAREIAEVRKEQVEYLKESAKEKSEIVAGTTRAISESAQANTKLAGAVTELTEELRSRRYQP